MDSKDVINVDFRVLNKTFPTVKNVDKSRLLMTNVGMYSVSKVKGASMLVNIIKKHISSDKITVTDATGNVGSDTIMLALNFDKVNSIELSLDQYEVLRHNIGVYDLGNKVNVIQGDSLEIIPTLEQDVIYIDAPWTGRDYKKNDKMSLFMSEKELSQVYNEMREFCKFIIFKVPRNYDFTYFMQHCNAIRVNLYKFMKGDEVSFYFILCF